MKLRAIITISIAAVLLAGFSYWVALQSYSWLPPEASLEAKLIDDLFAIFTGLGTFILVGVAIPIGYALVFHRAGKYDLTDGPHVEGNTVLEVIWTAVPLLLVAGLVTASYNAYTQMNIQGPTSLVHLHLPELMPAAYAEPAPEPLVGPKIDVPAATNIEVTARQWAWVFRYPEANITSTELHLPANRRVHLTLHSEDVLHGMYIPAFRLKQDVVPNHEIEFEFTPIQAGTYRLRDSMFSGTYMAANQTDVVVQPMGEFQQWLADAATQPPSPAYNQAADEYQRAQDGTAKDHTAVRGWQTIPPAPPPVVNYAPKHQPVSSPA